MNEEYVVEVPELTESWLAETAANIMVLVGCSFALGILVVQGSLAALGYSLKRRRNAL